MLKNDTVEGMLAEFIRTFEASLDPRVWANLIKEEKDELAEALEGNDKAHILKEFTDLFYVTIGFNLTSAGPEQMGLFSDREHGELMTILTEAQMLHEKAHDRLGNVNHIEAFKRVHESNMSKLNEDGTVSRRMDGKVLKGPNYKEPQLEDLIPDEPFK